jgi:beta-glucosidase
VTDVERLVRELTLDEKLALTAGEDFFTTPAVERLGIPKVRLTDGPNGARGTTAFPGVGGEPATSTPCATALGATWDPDIVRRLGAVIGREALDRGCHVLLAPTLNLHRSPLAGRNFECYSEDPLLAGTLGAAYVEGVQSVGVAATPKHFVGNDAEFERMTISSEIDDRTLREIYLVPFEMVVRRAAPLALMTAYNRLNGKWLTQRPEFLTTLLRDEWGFDGIVMTDWFGMADAQSVAAGLDLEMPGPPRAFGGALLEAVKNGTVTESAVDAAVTRLLRTWDRVGVLGAPTAEVDPRPTAPDVAVLLRRAAAQGCVLLTNDGVLPLGPAAGRRIAVIGPHATAPQIMGGGSAAVVAHPTPTFAEALGAAVGDGVELVVARGCEADRYATVLGLGVMPAPEGFDIEVFEGPGFDGPAVQREHVGSLRLMLVNLLGRRWPEGEFSLRAKGRVVPAESGSFEIGLSQSGRTRVFLDGELVLDGVEQPPPGGGADFFGIASQELAAPVAVAAGSPVDVVVEYTRAGAPIPGFRVGARTVDIDRLIDEAVAAAERCDAAVVFVGTTGEWETETRDRDSLALPGRQAELIRAVAAVNPRTVVVVNAGAPVDLSWHGEVAATLLCWFGGQELAPAVADVLTGAAEPGGRLPTTVPQRIEDSPSYGNFPGSDGVVPYEEGVFVGYRGFDARSIEPAFAFGHGLSYTTWRIDEPAPSAREFRVGEKLRISVPVTNTGERAGSHVVQCYVAPVEPRLERPPKELKAFRRVRLEPGETQVVELTLDDRAFAYWSGGWTVDPGQYDILIGRSSAETEQRVSVHVVT